MTILFSVVLIASLIAVSDDRRTLIGVSILLMVTLIVKWASYFFGGSGISAFSLLLTAITLGVVTMVLLRSLFRVKEIMTSTIWRAISIYIMIGLTWGMFFSFYEQIAPGSFIDNCHDHDRSHHPDNDIFQLRNIGHTGIWGHITSHCGSKKPCCDRGGRRRLIFGHSHIEASRYMETWW